MEIPKEVEDALRKEMHFPKKPMPQPAAFEVIAKAARSYSISSDRLLFCWLYLTGQRITEALQTYRRNVSKEEILGKNFLIVDSITLKNRQQARRRIAIPMFGFESELTDFVWRTIEFLKPEARLFYFTRQQAFNHLSRVQVECEFIKSESKERFVSRHSINPHYLRHCRADHMAHNHGFDHVRLMQFFGWGSSAMPNTYISTSGRNLAEGFIHT